MWKESPSLFSADKHATSKTSVSIDQGNEEHWKHLWMVVMRQGRWAEVRINFAGSIKKVETTQRCVPLHWKSQLRILWWHSGVRTNAVTAAAGVTAVMWDWPKKKSQPSPMAPSFSSPEFCSLFRLNRTVLVWLSRGAHSPSKMRHSKIIQDFTPTFFLL